MGVADHQEPVGRGHVPAVRLDAGPPPAGLRHRGLALAVPLQFGPGVLEITDVGAQPVRALRQVGQDSGQLVLARGRERGAGLVGLHLGGHREPEDQAEHSPDQLSPAGPWPHQVKDRPHAPNSFLRMAAALEKIRMPRTTTTPVDSWDPTPSWSPRKTIMVEMTALLRNDTTKTLSSKMPSSLARTPPNMAPSAATIAIGR